MTFFKTTKKTTKNINQNNIGATWMWIVVILLLIGMLAASIFIFWNKSSDLWTGDILKNEILPSKGRITYTKSIADTEEMALSGSHEFAFYNGYLYVTSIRDNGLEVMDISDPENPKHVSAFIDNEKTLMKKPHSVVFKDDYAYVGSMGDNAIQILNVSDPKNLLPINSVGLSYKGIHGTSINGNYLYIAYTTDSIIEIMDISDPENPKLVATLFDNEKLALNGPHEFLFFENYAYILTSTDGLEILDITDPTQPRHIASIKENDEIALSGGHGMDIMGNYIYTASYVDGFAIFDITNPEKPVQTAAIYPTEENGLLSSSDVDVAGDYAFVVSEVGNAIVMINISNPENPVIEDIIVDDGTEDMFLWNGHYIEVIGNYIYVAGIQDGFGILKFN